MTEPSGSMLDLWMDHAERVHDGKCDCVCFLDGYGQGLVAALGGPTPAPTTTGNGSMRQMRDPYRVAKDGIADSFRATAERMGKPMPDG